MLKKKRLPKGWTSTPLRNIACLINGRAFKPSDWSEEGLPIVRIQNLNDHSKPFNYCNFPVDEKFLIDDGQLLFSWSGTPGTSFGCFIWNRGQAILNQHIFKVEIDEKLFVKRFLQYAINQNLDRYIDKAHGGVGLRHITKGKFEGEAIIISPTNEQKRIVAKIESIFAQIDAAKERLEVLQGQMQSGQSSLASLKNSVLKQAFEGKLVPQNPSDESAEELLMRIGKNTGKNVVFEKEGLPEGWISIKFENIMPHSQSFDPVTEKNQKYIGLEHIEKDTGKIIGHADSNMALSTKTVFSKGDLLYGKLRPYLNKVAIAEFNGVCSTDILVFPKNPFIINNLLKFCLLKSDFVLFANNTITGVQHPRTSHKKLANYNLQIPPIQEQHRIVQKIESIFARIDAKHQEMEKLEMQLKSVPDSINMLKSSILKMAFEGRLVPQDPNDEPAEELLKKLQTKKSE